MPSERASGYGAVIVSWAYGVVCCVGISATAVGCSVGKARRA